MLLWHSYSGQSPGPLCSLRGSSTQNLSMAPKSFPDLKGGALSVIRCAKGMLSTRPDPLLMPSLSQHRHSSDACGRGEILKCSHIACWGSKHSSNQPLLQEHRNKEKEC